MNEDPWEKGKVLFQSAIDQGVVEGYLGLAVVARDEQDYEAALEYYQKVAEEGTEQFYVVSATKSIGDMYRYGDGMEQDGVKAIEWYQKAADLGNEEAQAYVESMQGQ